MIFISLTAALFSVVFPIVLGILTPAERPKEEPSPVEITPEISVVYTSPEAQGTEDGEVEVVVFIDGKAQKTDMHSYLVGVLAAEMPASFELEALKAQAVAARTFAVYKMKNGGSERYQNADVCTDITCCQAYCDENEMREKWGAEFESMLGRIESAVKGTDGDCSVYEGEPIFAAFHSSSCGKTETCAAVWGGEIPYLISVDSPENGDSVPNYTSRVSVSYDEFLKTVKERYPEAESGAEWVRDTVNDESGRLKSAVLCGVEVSGTEIRGMFSLRSAAMEISCDEYGVNFVTTGYGHGVGMSQYGANTLAERGFVYSDIIAWYYPGTELMSIKDLT
ncbi:MAG: stage II sporulation protein D [Oscillospiraceae bacterium]|nr:stage II sporulation protein D [Oscillospiraceae bacterium]